MTTDPAPDASAAAAAPMPDDPDLAGTLAFLREAGRLKDTLRSAHTGGGRQESTAEHSWRLALWVLALGERLPEGIDADRLLRILLVHDLGEALGGDVPAPLQHSEPDRAARERRDLEALVAPLPEGPREAILGLAREYDEATTPEGRLARGLDKLETILQHVQGDNPPGFDHAFNLGYGRDRTDAQPLTRALREPLDRETRRLAGTGDAG